ncbi:hypothetical protein [Plantibacter sp. YIM 135347]|uniref:hypothetical protein n=1 Tax=Plantibacter sp. YIM 135347 TaxID=3423919 RepID=UPI003D34DF01
MAPRWTPSSGKHGIERVDQIYALVHATYVERLLDECGDDGTVTLYIGPVHAQTDRELEVLVNIYDDERESVVFHAMPLGPKFRRYREDHDHD